MHFEKNIDLVENLDRFYLWASSLCAEPICRAFEELRFGAFLPLGKFDTYENNISEIARRSISYGLAFLATVTGVLPLGFLTLGITHKILRTIGFAIQKNGYTYIKGEGAEKGPNGKIKLATWNLCGICGGLHYNHCGVVPWRYRLEGILTEILNESPDVIVLQEVYDTALLEALVKKLSQCYPHFFTHLGPNVMGSVGGVMVITRCPVHNFTNIPFTNNDWTLNRTFATLEISETQKGPPIVRVIGTHLINGNLSKAKVQFGEIRDYLAKKTPLLPTLLAGDLNLEKSDEDEGGFLEGFLTHSYQGKNPTATNELRWQFPLEKEGPASEKIDYISQFKDVPQGNFEETHLIKAFDDTLDTRIALSDHNGIVTTFDYSNSLKRD